MKNELLKKTAIFSSLFSIIVIIVVFFAMENRVLLADNRHGDFSANKEIEVEIPVENILEENIVDIIVPSENIENIEEDDKNRNALIFELGNADTNYLIIPVPLETKKENVKIENHYLNEEMRIIIEGVNDDFYLTKAISGNRKSIITSLSTFEIDNGSVILKFALNDIYEYKSIIENDKIYVEFVPPREMHDRILVIDPAFGGSMTGIVANDLMEKDVVLKIALKLKELLDQTDYMVYYTRYMDNDLNEEKRVRIANNVKADMLIRIECDSNDDSLVNGTTTIYNSSFFIPHFGSPELADILETEVVLSIKGKGIGFQPATAEDFVIANATVPAAAIKVGHLTNAQEAILLGRDDYLEKIAVGIFNAIKIIYEEER